MAFQSKMALLASDSSPESKCFLFRLLMADREHKKKQVKGKNWAVMEDILKARTELALSS